MYAYKHKPKQTTAKQQQRVTPCSRPLGLESGVWGLGSGVWGLGSGVRGLGSGVHLVQVPSQLFPDRRHLVWGQGS